MAAKKTAAAPRTKPANTSAPLSETPAEVLAPAAEQSAAPATSQAVVADATVSEKTGDSPARGERTGDAAVKSSAPVADKLIVSSRTQGFRRAGRAWGTAPETVEAAEFTDAQIEALLAEPMLAVVVVAA